MSRIKAILGRLNPFVPRYRSSLDKKIARYNQTRIVRDTRLLCHAPFSNLYFNTEGDVALCWQTFHRAEKYTENKSIKEIWNSPNFNRIREGIKNHQLEYGCQTCRNHLLENNFTNILAKAYDNDFPKTDYPSIIEFELSNTCNLACTMCNGMLSSVIRRDREKLPPLKSPYGDKFLNELREFIPHLHEARFNGGEPFLIKLYYKIWDMVFELNPDLKMVIATNGTVLNDKVKEYLSRGNFHFNISMDGATARTYERIRINGSFEKLMQNFQFFLRYCKDHQRTLCIMVNPLRQNWQEMPLFVNFVNRYNIHIWFNTIVKPAEQALWSLPASKLQEIYTSLAEAPLDAFSGGDKAIYNYNITTYNNLVHQQIKTWLLQAREREQQQDAIIIRDEDSTKQKALSKIAAYLQDRDQDKKLTFQRIRETEQLMDDALHEDFFRILLDSNPETILDYSRKYSASELKDIFIRHIRH
ncbi:MAG: hypothetical protein KatS3mg031_2693 [Chitinophagales bacterium]|nr:MAG: hypothetical protein KatS3mg031_2693 [Chitinophagales bacterium]